MNEIKYTNNRQEGSARAFPSTTKNHARLVCAIAEGQYVKVSVFVMNWDELSAVSRSKCGFPYQARRYDGSSARQKGRLMVNIKVMIRGTLHD
jgi:hypothetical protein